jgi:hypothetical protein
MRLSWARRVGYFMNRGRNWGCVRSGVNADCGYAFDGCGSACSGASSFARGTEIASGAVERFVLSALWCSSVCCLKHLIEQL